MHKILIYLPHLPPYLFMSILAIFRRSMCVWTAGINQNNVLFQERKATGSGVSGYDGLGEVNSFPAKDHRKETQNLCNFFFDF